MALLRNKTGAKLLGFAICLKYFQLFAKFPDNQASILDTLRDLRFNNLPIKFLTFLSISCLAGIVFLRESLIAHIATQVNDYDRNLM